MLEREHEHLSLVSAAYEQAMACFRCGIASAVSSESFPRPPGLWDWPCPVCGHHSVWITEVIPKSDEPLSQERALSLVEDYLLGSFR